MVKRDYVAEILARRGRLRFRAPIGEMSVRFMFLELELMKAERLSDEMMRYFPIAIIACVESFFRLTIAGLIDDGAPFAERIDGFENVRIDLAILKAIHGRRITFGDFISHLVPLTSFDDINKALSVLLAGDFLAMIRERRESPRDLVERESIEFVGLTVGELFTGVEDAFRLRHMFAHEFASTEQIDRMRIRRCFNACVAFMLTADAVIGDIQSPNAPRTLAEAESSLAADLAEEEQRLAAAVATAGARLPVSMRKRFASAQRSWTAARDDLATLYGKVKQDKYTSPRLAYLQVAVWLTRRRISEIGLWLMDDAIPATSA